MADLFWFRRDLRLTDHPALQAAAEGGPLVSVFVLDPVLLRNLGEHRASYLRASLSALNAAIGGNRLHLRVGDPGKIIPELAAAYDAQRVWVSGEYTPFANKRDWGVDAALVAAGRKLTAVDSPYLYSPGTITKPDGEPYSVFTPYYRNWNDRVAPAPAGTAAPELFIEQAGASPDSVEQTLTQVFGGKSEVLAGEVAALATLDTFLADAVDSYGAQRNRPDTASTSQLSPALHFGEIHPRSIVARAAAAPVDAAPFVRQLCWRDFYADVLYHRPEAAWHNLDRKFAAFPWRTPENADGFAEDLAAWQQGQTGYPFVDAGMRQLLRTGWMHNRTRMVTASFLTKDLRIPWQYGAQWFLCHLKDGDIANNSLGWQWTAGTGTDAAPYFRVFNPVLQGQRFDPQGQYIRAHVPELRHLEAPAVHEPWTHPQGSAAGYPDRMLDHHQARQEALAGLETMKERS
ncbi:MAG: DNA photolyase family protein [Actinomycetia bacterium]|nr:DNA photolyase family protein [Actinomycetes bacterium]